jgi:transposase-like protein
MGGRRIAAIALSGALAAGGTGAAIAAVTRDDGKKAEQEVLADAAKRLNVAPDKLRDALAAAQDAQIDAAVKAGKLTQAQADKIKAARKQSGSVLGGPHFRGGPRLYGGKGMRGDFGMRGGPGLPGPGGGMIGDLAKALGLSNDKLFEQLRDGKSIADVAKAQGKSLDDVRATIKAATKTRLDKAVDDGDLTRKRADAMLERLDMMLKDLDAKHPLLGRRHRHLRGEPGPAPELRPGGLLPGESVPEIAPPEGVFN